MANSGYKKLFSNTLIFALGSFSSKILMILLVNVYTTYLTQAEMGVNDVIQQIANWLLPIVTFTISESVIRFGLDKVYDKKQVFTIANTACFGGLALLAAVLPIVTVSGVADKYLQGYSALIFVYMITASLKLVYSNFLRALEKIKLYAINSILTTALTLIGTILFICVFKMGNAGYLYSIIVSDFLSILFMLVTARLWKYFDYKRFDRELAKTMFAYCIPLIPAQIMWLITNSSDSFMTTYYIGPEKNGILSASYKIANLVSTVYLMFGQAWNMSAIMEDDSDDRDEFYSNVFHINQCLLYILAAGCLMICRPLTAIWMGDAFQESARYSPILIYSTIFSCFTTFMGSIYLASNKTKRSLVTSLISGAVNIGLNVILIPRIGLYGPPISTVVSYLAVFIVRAYDSRRLVPFDLRLKKLVGNNILLIIMTVICAAQYFSKPLGILAAITLPLMFILVAALNIRPVWRAMMSILPSRIKNILERIGTIRLIILCFVLAGYAVLCWFVRITLPLTMLIIFSAAAAYGTVRKKEGAKMLGAAGIFVTLWISSGIANAFTAILVLAAFSYLHRAEGWVFAVGCISFISVIGTIFGSAAGVFTALIILLTAAVTNLETVFKLINKLTSLIGRSKK